MGKWKPIDFDGYVESGIVNRIGLDAVELGSFRESHQEIRNIELDAGEYESICILCTRLPAEAQICTGDKAAINAIVLLGHIDRCLSLESLLISASLPAKVDKHFSKRGVEKEKRDASVRRVQNL